MNIFLWVVQILLAIHTAMGAVWKLKNPVESMGSLKAIPQGLWRSMSVVELFCTVALVVPAVHQPLGLLAPIAASVIGAEMLLLSGVHLRSGEKNKSPVVYWLVVAAVCAFVAFGRLVLRPH